jgi:hypothetical protein
VETDLGLTPKLLQYMVAWCYKSISNVRACASIFEVTLRHEKNRFTPEVEVPRWRIALRGVLQETAKSVIGKSVGVATVAA